MDKIVILLILIIIQFGCRKSNEMNDSPITKDQWKLIPFVPNYLISDFYEDKQGNVTYRDRNGLWMFDSSGNLLNTIALPTVYDENVNIGFMNDGSIYMKTTPVSGDRGDFILWYKKVGNFSYASPVLIDLKDTDSLGIYSGEYYIFDIAPNNTSISANDNSAALYVHRFNNIKDFRLNKNPNPEVILLSGIWNKEKKVLPKDAIYNEIVTTKSHFILLNSTSNNSLSINKSFISYVPQNKLQAQPKLNYLNNLVIKSNDGFYTSVDGVNISYKINGINSNDEIFHSNDSLLFINSNGELKSVNGITGLVEEQVDLKSSRMPVSIDTLYIRDYYRSKKMLNYVVTSRGIIIASQQ